MLQASTKAEIGQKQKSVRMEEWSRLPLQDWSHMEHWMAAVSDQYTIESSSAEPLMEPVRQGLQIPVSPSHGRARGTAEVEVQEASPVYPWQSRRDVPLRRLNIHSPREMDSSMVYSDNTAIVGSENVISQTDGILESPGILGVSDDKVGAGAREQPTRADELSKSNPGLYF